MHARAHVTVTLGRFEDLVAEGLRSLVAQDPSLELVATGVALDDLGAHFARIRPRVAILSFEALRGAADVHALHAAHPDTRLVLLAARPSPSDCTQMLALGATACLSKETQARDVLNAIHLASRGLHVIPRPSGDAGPGPCGPEVLTPREADVLGHIQRGRSNKEIAVALCVSVETVRTHARGVFRKLGVHSRRELAGTTR